MENETKKSGSSAVNLVVLGASLAGLAASAFFFFGPKGKKNQRHAKAWAIKMKGDVVEKLEMADEVSEAVYKEIIDSVAAEYKKGMKAGDEEINALAQDMKEHWKAISRTARETKLDIEKDAKKAAKKNNNKKDA
jgi:RecA/RadA recombinase